MNNHLSVENCVILDLHCRGCGTSFTVVGIAGDPPTTIICPTPTCSKEPNNVNITKISVENRPHEKGSNER